MPWNKVSLMTQRKELIEKLLLPGANVSAICKEHSISRKTAYKWLSRYKEGSLQALEDQRKTPKRMPLKLNSKKEAQIISAQKEYPYWSPRKLRNFLLNEKVLEDAPSVSTFARIFERNDCKVISNLISKPATIRFERSSANELWQMDFKGSFMTDAHRCYPLTIIDDYSRYSIGLQACKDEQRETVKARLIACFKAFGLPDQINVDNGNPWGNAASGGCSKLVIWLVKCGVRVTHSSPYHPQTNGKDERFHRTLKLEVLHQKKYKSCSDIQKTFSEWQHLYNYKRPHDALGGKPPCSRYIVSAREYSDKAKAIEYDEGSIVRKVSADRGMFCFNGKKYRAGKGVGGEYISLKETKKDDEYSVFFMDTFIKKFNLMDGV